MTPHRLESPVPRRPTECPVEDWVGFLGHRWTVLVLWHLRLGSLKHGEIQARLPGVTAKVLGERLGALSRRGLVERDPIATFPRTVRYRLTARGRGLLAVLDGIEAWAAE